MFDPKLKEALGRVQKPGRYTGGEPGSVYKDKRKKWMSALRFCFPDTYEVGMSFLGEKILYELLNSHEKLVVRACFYAVAGYEGRDGASWSAALHHGEQGPAHRF